MSDPSKTVPISGRIAEEDYEFLMRYALGGKVTASEKLRAMASFYRQFHESLDDYGNCLDVINHMLERSRKEIKSAELNAQSHSALVDALYQWLPEVMAYMATRRKNEKKDEAEFLATTEKQLLQSTLRLTDTILRLGLTEESPTYDTRLLKGKLKNTVDLVRLIERSD